MHDSLHSSSLSISVSSEFQVLENMSSENENFIAKVFNLPIIRNGAAKFIPMNSTLKYIANPKAAAVAIDALIFPSKPSHGFDRTVSPIIQVKTLLSERLEIENDLSIFVVELKTYLKIAIKIKVDPKYGITVRVFFSSS